MIVRNVQTVSKKILFEFHVFLRVLQFTQTELAYASSRNSDSLLLELHVEAQTTNLIGQNVEAGRSSRFERVFALDH